MYKNRKRTWKDTGDNEQDINNESRAQFAGRRDGPRTSEAVEPPVRKDMNPGDISGIMLDFFRKKRHGEKKTIRDMLVSPPRAMDFIPVIVPASVNMEIRELEQHSYD